MEKGRTQTSEARPLKSQQDLFNRIADQYHQHYHDPTSLWFRQQLLYPAAFGHITHWKGLRVLDLMAGTGELTIELLRRGAQVTAVDISSQQLELLKRSADQQQLAASLEIMTSDVFLLQFGAGSFDLITCWGGLHHLMPRVGELFEKAFPWLSPQGQLICFEPVAPSLFNLPRRCWYALDRHYFESNEAPIEVRSLEHQLKGQWSLEREFYGLGPYYLFLYNSLIWRLPLGLKRYLAPWFYVIDRVFSGRIPIWMAMYGILVWRKH